MSRQQMISEAKRMGIGLTDAKVLSIDPYFVGNDKEIEAAKWAAGLWDRVMAKRKKALHLRGFHYAVMSLQTVKPDGKIYAHEDPAADWGMLTYSCQMARYLGIGTWENLVDFKHPDPNDYNVYEVNSGLENEGNTDVVASFEGAVENFVDNFISQIVKSSPRYADSYYQTYHTEVWCEKGSMGFVIKPMCQKYHACYQSLVGQASVEKASMSCRRALKAAQAGKKVRIFYIADADRYGRSMIPAVARKIEFFTQSENIDIKLTRICLTDEQIEEYKLPRTPKKDEWMVELDALEAIHPGALGKIIENALKPYWDSEKPAIVREENKRMREAVEKLLNEKVRPSLEKAFENIDLEKLKGADLTEVIDNDFEAPEPGMDVDEDDNWIYDSGRDYWEQWKSYKDYKENNKEVPV